jgi:hypothetical protein
MYGNLVDQHNVMSAQDPILAIVKSLDSRKALLQVLCGFTTRYMLTVFQIASNLGIYDNPRLRDALREDEQQIAAIILTIMNSGSERAAVLRLEGDFAQSFLDVVQNVGSPAIARYLLMSRIDPRQRVFNGPAT